MAVSLCMVYVGCLAITNVPPSQGGGDMSLQRTLQPCSSLKMFSTLFFAYGSVPRARFIDPLELARDRRGACRSHQAGDFDAVAQEHQRGPAAHLERAPERPPAGVLDLQVPHLGMRGERVLDNGLDKATNAT